MQILHKFTIGEYEFEFYQKKCEGWCVEMGVRGCDRKSNLYLMEGDNYDDIFLYGRMYWMSRKS